VTKRPLPTVHSASRRVFSPGVRHRHPKDLLAGTNASPCRAPAPMLVSLTGAGQSEAHMIQTMDLAMAVEDALRRRCTIPSPGAGGSAPSSSALRWRSSRGPWRN
jgi:hypothetical protein